MLFARFPRRRRAEEPAHHFLAGADLGKRAVAARIEMDRERLEMGIDRCLFHGVEKDLLNSLADETREFVFTR